MRYLIHDIRYDIGPILSISILPIVCPILQILVPWMLADTDTDSDIINLGFKRPIRSTLPDKCYHQHCSYCSWSLIINIGVVLAFPIYKLVMYVYDSRMRKYSKKITKFSYRVSNLMSHSVGWHRNSWIRNYEHE